MRAKVPFREERERLVMAGVLAGDTNREIAAKLGLSHPTIKQALRALCRKNGVRSRTQLVAQDALDPDILDERIRAAVDKALAKHKGYQDDIRELRQTVETFKDVFNMAMNRLNDSQFVVAGFYHDAAQIAGMLRAAMGRLDDRESVIDLRAGDIAIAATIKRRES